MTDRVGHSEDRKAKCERNAQKTDAEIGKPRGENGGATATKRQPERAKELRRYSPRKVFHTILRSEKSSKVLHIQFVDDRASACKSSSVIEPASEPVPCALGFC